MNVTVAALVGFDTRERVEVRLPGLSSKAFRGPSIAELLDDAALHLMERVPKWPAARLHTLVLNPEVCLRKITVQRTLSFGEERKGRAVDVRLTCVCTRWSADGFWQVEIPRLGGGAFAVPNLAALTDGASEFLERWSKKGSPEVLEAARSLRDERIELIDLEVELPSVLPSRKPPRKPKRAADGPPPPIERTWIPARELRQVAVDLVHRALDGRLQPALGREPLVDDLVRQLQADGAALLLVGEPGVGKTAIVEAVAQRFADEGRPLQERTDLWRVDAARLIAGMSFVGAWEHRLGQVVEELVQRRDVLVVDDLPGLAWAGRSAQSETTMAGYLLPHLQRGELRVLAECTPERLEAGRQRNPGFFACFRVIRVDAMGPAATARVLLQHLRAEEAHRPIVGAPELIEAAMALGRRFGARLAEPGRSVSLFRRFLAETRSERLDPLGRAQIGPRELLDHFGAATGLPRFVLEPGTGMAPDALREQLASSVIGQPAAVEAMVDVVATLQEGIDDPDRPVATLLFVGPTGVGKTESAKALAALLFGDASRLVRFDMSEVQGTAGLTRLIGGPGRPDGDLTRAVSNQPFSVVLLDEIEKAGSAVFDVLLQVLGEGRLTNAVGQTTDFRNTVVVMTSNLGVDTARRRTGFGATDATADDAHYRGAAQRFFRPEMFNRIDRVVPFRALDRGDIEPLVQRIVGRVLGRRGLRRAGVVVRIDEDLRDHLATAGFDPQYGARALHRVVEREITVPLARLLVDRPPGERGAYVELWRGTEGMGLALDPLQDAPTASRPQEPPSDWPDLAALFDTVSARIDALDGDPAWASLEGARSALLAGAAGLGTEGWDRLLATSAVVDERATLTADLQDFATDWLEAFRYTEGWEVDRAEHRWFGTRKRLVSRSEPVPVDRSRTLGAASAQLTGLALRAGALAHRVRHHGQDTPFVLLFEPLHQEALGFARRIARAFVTGWSEWGRIEPVGPTDLADDAGDPDVGFALGSAIPGLRALIEPDLGLWLHAEDRGADRHLQLVRVLAVAGADPLRALAARAEDRRSAREARRHGVDAVPLPGVVHRFGVLHPGTPGAPELSSLARDLVRSALLRA